MADQLGHDALITELVEITGLDPQVASQYLRQSDWDVETAAQAWYASLDDATDSDLEPERQSEPPSQSNPPSQSGPTMSRSKPTQKKKFATLGDLSSGGDGDEDRSSDGPRDQDMFAGGEKSGLAVHNPDDLRRRILEKARQNAPRPGGDDPSPPKRSNFIGTAHVLGGDDVPSSTIEDPSGRVQPRRPPERSQRVLHFWNDGFSVDDGPLYRRDDPKNAHLLRMIESGRAPLELLNVTQDLEVDVKVEQHDGAYKPPKPKPFSGTGRTLGSSAASASVQAQPPPPSAATGSAPKVEVDDSQPTVAIQVRLADGTRLASRFNTTHTVGDIYSFVRHSNTESASQSWSLLTTFPTKELDDHAAVIGELSELKRGGTVIQKRD